MNGGLFFAVCNRADMALDTPSMNLHAVRQSYSQLVKYSTCRYKKFIVQGASFYYICSAFYSEGAFIRAKLVTAIESQFKSPFEIEKRGIHVSFQLSASWRSQ